jgi:hypothetical protein
MPGQRLKAAPLHSKCVQCGDKGEIVRRTMVAIERSWDTLLDWVETKDSCGCQQWAVNQYPNE